MSTKKRLIFALLYSDGFYCQSRNFHLQKVGKFDWLFNNYNFSKVAEHLDELVVINVNPRSDNQVGFFEEVKQIINNVFIPIAIGGGISDIKSANMAFNSGADKIILNSLVRENTSEVRKVISEYGSQSVVAAIDYKRMEDEVDIFEWRGRKVLNNTPIKDYVLKCQELGFGEILLNSVNKDGTGFGYDLDIISDVASYCELPLMVMGGAGKYDHFLPVFEIDHVDAAITANLLNFIGDAIADTRTQVMSNGIDLAKFI